MPYKNHKSRGDYQRKLREKKLDTANQGLI
jgi:hypothetical protein